MNYNFLGFYMNYNFLGFYMNYNKEAKGLTFRRGSEVSQDKDSTKCYAGVYQGCVVSGRGESFHWPRLHAS